MQAEIFYQASSENTVLLTLVNQSECEQMKEALSSLDRNLVNSQQFFGKYGEIAFISNSEGHLHKILIGSGEGDETLAIVSAISRLPAGFYNLQPSISQRAMVGWSLAQYGFDNYKAQEWIPRVLSLPADAFAQVLDEANAIFLVRDLINTPTNDLSPQELGQAVITMAKKFSAEFEQWIGKELLDNNFPAIHTVGAAAATAPRLLSLRWGSPNHPKVTLVGKGVCFDSGGLDLKTAVNMRLMKKDMAGAAHVLGLGQWIMSQRLPIRLHILIPAIENAVSSQSYRPGDVLTMRNGLTVEIDNTDAEGRLILADALVKACEDHPELVIDFATLTGSARVAVGTEISALFTNNDLIGQEILSAGLEVDDPVWQLPLFKAYETLLNSTVADLANACPSPYGGAITAALFLNRFIPPNISWVHFDIMAWNLLSKPGKPEGGEAMGLRAVAYYLSKRYGI
jgi:leucyl aminopeptidase